MRPEILFVALLLAPDCHALATRKKPLLRRIRSAIAPFSLPFYEDGLRFSCTGCGKCCKVDGDVWLAPEEVASVMDRLGYCPGDAASREEFRRTYVRAEVAPSDGDASLSWMCLKREEGACIFLDPLGKCSIYDVRPVQCSTYPFWPSLLRNKDAWEEESAVPDDVAIEKGSDMRHWSPEMGGCEGISIGGRRESENSSDNENAKADVESPEDGVLESTIVERDEIVLKMRAARKHWKRFPVQEIKESTWYL
ncbi:hypothetical protein ACHAWF_015515 [Thalassiosira exigua]